MTARVPAGLGGERLVQALEKASGRPGLDAASLEEIEWVLRLAEKHRGPQEPLGRQLTVARTVRVNAWWFDEHHDAPHMRTILVDEDGLIYTHRKGRGFAVNPVATAGRWYGLNAGTSLGDLAAALLPLGVARATSPSVLVWEYFDVADEPKAVAPGASAMAQARVALLLSGAYAESGDAHLALAAAAALRAFLLSPEEGGVTSTVTDPGTGERYPWYVERAYPGQNPWKGGALNGAMVAVTNLRRAAEIFDSAPTRSAEASEAAGLARSLADRGASSVSHLLPLHDTGDWSLYGMLTPGRPWRTHRADTNYHCYHIELLNELQAFYPDRGFDVFARKWLGYVETAGRVCQRDQADVVELQIPSDGTAVAGRAAS